MPARLPSLALLALLAGACSSSDKSSATEEATSIAQRQKAIAQLNIPFSSPVLIDSSACVMYPLSLREIIQEEASGYSSYSSYSRSENFWNMAFFNTKTGSVKLLDEGRRMVIQSYKIAGDENSSDNSHEAGSPSFVSRKLLYFSVITTDFNHDKQLTDGDPIYLFTSDKSGTNFTQISPDSMNVAAWSIQEKTGKLLLQVQPDSDHNRRFDGNDASIPYVYDLTTRQPATVIFNPQFTQKIKAEFQKHWPAKP